MKTSSRSISKNEIKEISNPLTTGSKNYPPPIRKKRYYTPEEVRIHNTSNDCWVSLFNDVYDLTELVQENLSCLIDPIVKNAGNDITHWFNATTREPKSYVVPNTNLIGYFCPEGNYLNVPPDFPDSEWDYSFEIPWWNNSKYKIGNLSKNTRTIKIINTLTKQHDVITVCSEETINEILVRYKTINEHAESYTWKRMQRVLDMELTLDENDILDETDQYLSLDIDPEYYIPALHLYFNDDLTEA